MSKNRHDESEVLVDNVIPVDDGRQQGMSMRRRVTLGQGMVAEFVFESESLDGSCSSGFISRSSSTTFKRRPSITHLGDEVVIDFLNFSGKCRVRRVPGHQPISTREQKQEQEQQKQKQKQPIQQQEEVGVKSENPSKDESQAKGQSSEPGKEESSMAIKPTNLRANTPPSTVLDETATEEDEEFEGQGSSNETDESSSLLHEIEVGTQSPKATKRQTVPRERAPPRYSMVAMVPTLQRTSINASFHLTGQTELHVICASKSPDLRRLQQILIRDTESAKQIDARGQLPLHVLGNNSDLVNSIDGQRVATKCALLLIDAYSQAIVTTDDGGQMPFTNLILKWVEWTFVKNQDDSKTKSIASPKPKSSAVSMIQDIVHMSRKESRTSDAIQSVRDSLHSSSHRFPPVTIFDEVEWCFEMLSFGMDHLGGKPLDSSKKARPTLSYQKQRKNREALATNVAEIPMLLKAILLLESVQVRYKIMDSSIIRRVLFCPQVIGRWLTTMIRRKRGIAAENAVDFLDTLSKVTVQDYLGDYRKPLPEDTDNFKAAKVEMYSAVEDLGDMIPSLIVAGEQMLNAAVATPVIWSIMNRRMATPFSVCLAVLDFQLHLTALIAFRQLALKRIGNDDFSPLFPWMTLNSVIFWVGVTHFVKRICETMALGRISWTSAIRHFFDPWNLLDLVGIILSIFIIVYTDRVNDGVIKWPFLWAIAIGLLWMRVLGFLKIINEQLATFVLALSKILYDIRFFFLVLVISVLTFGDMFQIIFQYNPSIDCGGEDLNDPTTDFCSDRQIDSYLRVYAVIIGDFELSDYKETPASIFLWFSITFFGTVVLFNVLIAVVTVSYATSEESSVILFRRARAQFVATHTVMERFLRPNLSKLSSSMSIFNPVYIFLWLLRWIMIGTFLLTTIWSFLFLVQGFVIEINRFQWFGVLVIGIILVLSAYSTWATFVFTTSALVEQIVPEGCCKVSLRSMLDKVNSLFVRTIAARVFGVDPTNIDGGGVVQENETLFLRLERLEKRIEKILEREEKRIEEADFNESMALMQSSEFFR